MSGPRVHSIWIAPAAGSPLVSMDSAALEAGRGIVGDRYHSGDGSFSRWPGAGRAITLIAGESIQAVRDHHGMHIGEGRSRRNIITTGIDTDDLLGRHFRIGTALLRGIRSCQPCRHLERLLFPGAFEAMRGRGGIRADILESGTIAPGDAIRTVGPQSFLP